MRILFIQPTGDKRGHYGLWTSKICQAIGKTGNSLTLFTNKIYPERYLEKALTFRIIEAEEGRFAFDKFDECCKTRPWYYWYGYFRNTYRIVKAALEYCKKEKFDVIFLTDAEYMIASMLIKRFSTSISSIVWHVQAANFTFDTYSGSYLKKLYKVFQREKFKKIIGENVKGFAVLGNYHKESLKEQLNLSGSFPVEVIPDGGEVAENLMDRFEARKTIGIDYKGPIFLFLGMLRKDKGIEYLIEAVSYLKNKKENFKVVIAGSLFEYSESDIKKLIQEYNISEKVILRLTYIPDEEVPLYYFSSDAVIFPYSNMYKGSSGPLIKGACTYGKPVIVTDISEMGRLVRQHRFGLLAEAENPKSLADRMEEFLLLSENEKNELAKNAISLARQNSWDAVAKKLVDFLERAASH